MPPVITEIEEPAPPAKRRNTQEFLTTTVIPGSWTEQTYRGELVDFDLSGPAPALCRDMNEPQPTARSDGSAAKQDALALAPRGI